MRTSTGHPRDIADDDIERLSARIANPQVLRAIVQKSRERLGFFPAHNPRVLEYPWIVANLPQSLKGVRILDVGAGVNALPFMLADRGASVTTVDNHPLIRSDATHDEWNEWGFLDYGRIDQRIVSLHVAYEDCDIEHAQDAIFSVSVIEHLPRVVREKWLLKFASQIKARGTLLLTVDLVPGTEQLWNRSEGKVVEEPEVHGDLTSLLKDIAQAGFEIVAARTERAIPDSVVDIGLIHALRSK